MRKVDNEEGEKSDKISYMKGGQAKEEVKSRNTDSLLMQKYF